jgi:hypothetical protein
MPHQVLKASVKGSTGDLAKITAKLLTVPTSTPGQQINILSISAGEATIPASNGDPAQEYGVVSMILSPDDPTTTSNVIAALTNFPLGGTRKVRHVDAYPLVHVELANVPGSLGAAADAIGDLNIMSVISMGNVAETAHVALAFNAGDETTATDRLTAAGIVVHPPEPD